MNRRGFLGAILAASAAPAIITTPGLLMPVRKIITPVLGLISYTGEITWVDNEYDARLGEALRPIETHYREEFIKAFEQHESILRDTVHAENSLFMMAPHDRKWWSLS